MNRRIFQFKDESGKDVFADPSEIDYQIERLEIKDLIFSDRIRMIPTKADGDFDWEKAPKEDAQLVADNYRQAYPLLCEAFGLRPLDRSTGQGVTYSEMMGIYADFCDWKDGVKKNGENAPNSPENTDSTPHSPPGTQADSSVLTPSS